MMFLNYFIAFLRCFNYLQSHFTSFSCHLFHVLVHFQGRGRGRHSTPRVTASSAVSVQGAGPSQPIQIVEDITQVSHDWEAPTDGLVSFNDVMDAVDRACDAMELDCLSRVSHPKGVQNGPAFRRRRLRELEEELRNPNRRPPVFSPESSDTERYSTEEITVSNNAPFDEDFIDSAASRQQGLGAVVILHLSSGEEDNVEID